ncbi:MAG TPA: tripartite tricarboxylate transporter substrate binding protein [Xanthobacteraceae bacterium]|nr:tripartite tricarboxylate transporter substrate binding protein [Xanthobacteraceae bacterium]
MIRRFVLSAISALVAMCVVHSGANAQGGSFPNRPIKLITLTSPGGSLDTVARTIARYLPDHIAGAQVVVENRVGAGGNIGADAVAKSPSDGYTIGMVTISTHGINPTLYGAKMPFDAVKDFAPITPAVQNNNIITLHPSVPAKNVAEFVAYLKANPDKISFGSAGTGTSQHLAGEMFKVLTGTRMTHVPYKGAALAVPDLLSGTIQVMIPSSLEVGEHIKTGKLRGIAMTGKQRSPQFPDILPVAEQGFPDFDVVTWFGVVAPAGTPPELVQRYNTAIRAILSMPEVKERLAAGGFDTVTDKSPEQFAEFIKAEIAKWAPIVKESGAKIE